MQYSVLMSVYIKEKPEFLKQAMESIRMQTVPTNDFVLVCDGPLTDALETVIKEEQDKFGAILRVIRIKENGGLGKALNEGLKLCKNELVARMDSDDLSKKDRCQKQIKLFTEDLELAFTSGTVSEFEYDPTTPEGKRNVPISYEDIKHYSRKRNPMNHPCVMFKKSAVEDSGGYKETFHLFEDYYLWVRMMMNGYKAVNLEDVLLDMRTPADIYLRRGGKKYANDLLKFHKWLLKNAWSTKSDYLTGALPHALICVLPNGIRKQIYKILHR